MAYVKEITDETFEEAVLKADRPVVVDFWATWCMPCLAMAPELERLAEKYDGTVDFVKIECTANQAWAGMLQVHAFPTLAFFRPGQQPAAITGARPAEAIEAAFGLTQYATVAS